MATWLPERNGKGKRQLNYVDWERPAGRERTDKDESLPARDLRFDYLPERVSHHWTDCQLVRSSS